MSLLFSCQEEEAPIQSENVSISDILLSLSRIEYALYTGDKELASSSLTNIESHLTLDRELISSSEEELQKIVENILYMTNNISIPETGHLLDKLRTVKGLFMSLETDDDYDPYLYMIWQYEEEMYYTTKAAMDPMLDLFEWSEFEKTVDSMNEHWAVIMHHYPSKEIIDQSQEVYRNQISKKIRLDRSMKEFNYQVLSDHHEDNTLCEAAIELRASYINYLRTLLMIEDSTHLYLT